MNTNVSIHLSEHAFELLSERASSVGKTPAELAASVVENACSQECSPFLDGAIARAEFERCFGSIDLGHPIGLSNDAIDADLVREFGNTGGCT